LLWHLTPNTKDSIMTATQQEIIQKLEGRVRGFTMQRGGTRGYALKVNNMARKAERDLVAAGLTAAVAHTEAWQALARGQH
jgi:hypothetical protein